MFEFINQYSVEITGVLGFLIVIIGALGVKDYMKVKDLIFKLVVEAETIFKSKEGQEKFNFVIDHLYENLPKGVSLFANNALFHKIAESIIENVLETLKMYLDGKDINTSEILTKAVVRKTKSK